MNDHKTFQIKIRSQSSAFSASDVIEGSLLFKKPSKLKSLKLYFKGYADVNFEVKKIRTFGRYYKKSTFIERSQKVLLNEQMDLIGEDRHGQAKEEIGFSFRLPEALVDSFKHDLGEIKYFVKAVAVIDSSRYECIRPFDIRIRSHVCSLEHQAELQLPNPKRALIHRLLQDEQPSAQILLGRHWFGSNDEIKFGISVHNTSNHSISSIEVYLQQTILFKSASGTRSDEDKLAKYKITNQVKPHTSQTFANVSLRIPSAHSKFLATSSCGIIQVQHCLVLAFKLLNVKQASVFLPICIHHPSQV